MADRARTAINPSDQESTPSAMMKMLRDFMLNVDDCLPAIVVNYDRGTNIATVKPLITRLTVNDEAVPRNQVVDVEVFSFGGGGFHINFPLGPGDLGWIKASDRDLSNYRASLGESPPASSVTHSFDSSLFLPDVFRKYVIQGEHADEAVFQSVNGTNRVAIGGGRIKIATGGTYIELVDGKVTVVTDLLEVQAPESTFSGNVTIAGRTIMNGGFDSSGGGNSSVDQLNVNGKPVDGHRHSDPQGGNTGPF